MREQLTARSLIAILKDLPPDTPLLAGAFRRDWKGGDFFHYFHEWAYPIEAVGPLGGGFAICFDEGDPNSPYPWHLPASDEIAEQLSDKCLPFWVEVLKT